MTKRINIWSSPRNISTALMYSFSQRDDITVVDEPLYAHYLSKTDTAAHHPGTAAILHSQEQDGEKVINEVILGNFSTQIALFKQMTHHLIHLKEEFLLLTDNVILIRSPREIIASYAKVIPNPSIDDIGIKKAVTLFNKLQKVGTLNAVVDAKELLLHPKNVLQQLCERLGINFSESMLNWPKGARPEDGVWAKYWYQNVHNSTGFKPYAEKDISLSPILEDLALQCEPYYQRLYEYALKHNG